MNRGDPREQVVVTPAQLLVVARRLVKLGIEFDVRYAGADRWAIVVRGARHYQRLLKIERTLAR